MATCIAVVDFPDPPFSLPKTIIFSIFSAKIYRSLGREYATKKDFRVNPTLSNLKRFAGSIQNARLDRSSFFRANRIHYLINQSVISSKKKKRVTIN